MPFFIFVAIAQVAEVDGLKIGTENGVFDFRNRTRSGFFYRNEAILYDGADDVADAINFPKIITIIPLAVGVKLEIEADLAEESGEGVIAYVGIWVVGNAAADYGDECDCRTEIKGCVDSVEDIEAIATEVRADFSGICFFKVDVAGV